MIWVVLAFVVVMNIVSFALMAIDKKRAKANKWRIRERTLFIATGLFGGLGGMLGMYLLRHKTKHWYFVVFFPIMLAVQVGALIYIFKALL